MADIVERLREVAVSGDACLCDEAADEIERLRKRGYKACACHWTDGDEPLQSACAAHEGWRDEAVAAEREECAKIAEAFTHETMGHPNLDPDVDIAAEQIATEIRNRNGR